jgi:predicted DNA binding protein
MVYEVLIQSPGKLRILERGLRKIGMKLVILGSYSRSSMELTERQWEIIKKAYEEGYFDHDRKTSLTTMAKEIGISPAGLSDIMRRGVEKIVQDYLRNR